MPSPIQLSQELQRINGKKLETFRLHTYDAPSSLFLYSSSSSSSGAVKAVVSQYSRGKSRFFDLGATFPVLSTLKISTEKLGEYCSDGLEEIDLPGLPDTLTTLICPQINIYDKSLPVCSWLPRELMVLKSRLILVKEDDARSVLLSRMESNILPPGNITSYLQDVSLEAQSSTDLSVSEAENEAENDESSSSVNEAENDQSSSSSSENDEYSSSSSTSSSSENDQSSSSSSSTNPSPSSASRLSDPIISFEFWRDAPPNLHTISYIKDETRDDERPISNETISAASLPRSLCHYGLLGHDAGPSDLHFLQSLPPKTALFRIKFPLRHSSLLGPDVHNASKGGSISPELTYNSLKLPPEIKYLVLHYSEDCKEAIPVTFVSSLPTTISVITFIGARSTYDYDSLKYVVEKSQINRVNFWPPLLRTLVLKNIPLNNDFLQCLPTTLTTLSGEWSENWGDAEDLNPELLPACIKNLSLCYAYGLICKFAFRLPNTLEYLHLEQKKKKCDSKVCSQLPTSLKTLYMETYSITNFADHASFISSIHLTSLRVKSWNVQLFKFLPRSLVDLKLGIIDPDGVHPPQEWDDYLMELPNTLEDLKLRYDMKPPVHLRLDFSFAFLPKLKRLVIKDNIFFSTQTLLTLPNYLNELHLCLYDFKHLSYINPLWPHVHLDCINGEVYQIYHEHLEGFWPWSELEIDRAIVRRNQFLLNRAKCFPDPRIIRPHNDGQNTVTSTVSLNMLSSVIQQAAAKSVSIPPP